MTTLSYVGSDENLTITLPRGDTTVGAVTNDQYTLCANLVTPAEVNPAGKQESDGEIRAYELLAIAEMFASTFLQHVNLSSYSGVLVIGYDVATIGGINA
jgi:hypothetical protein